MSNICTGYMSENVDNFWGFLFRPLQVLSIGKWHKQACNQFQLLYPLLMNVDLIFLFPSSYYDEHFSQRLKKKKILQDPIRIYWKNFKNHMKAQVIYLCCVFVLFFGESLGLVVSMYLSYVWKASGRKPNYVCNQL